MIPDFPLSVSHVSKRYGRQVALDDVSFQAPAGSIVALLGENGAGKTSTLRILLGLTLPDSGTAQVLGLDSCKQGREIRRRVGYVSERPVLYDWMTVAEIGWFAAGFYNSDYLPSYKKLAERFELPGDRKLSALSKGMRAKVALALAMAHEPPVLILDEPTSGLDPLVRRQFLESMVDVAATGRTVILSSHQIAEVERVADIIGVIRKGKLVLWEKLEDLKQRTCELTLTLKPGIVDPPRFDGEILSRNRDERQHRYLVRDFDTAQLDRLSVAAELTNVESRHPSLDEMFMALMTDQAAKAPEKAGA